MEDQDACTMCTSRTFLYRVGDEFYEMFLKKSNAKLQSGRFQEESITRVGKTLPSQVYDDQIISMRLMIMIPLIKIY